MKKIILLSITFSFQIFGAGEEGSGNSPITTTLDGVTYQLVCTSASQDSTQQSNDHNCVFLPVSTD